MRLTIGKLKRIIREAYDKDLFDDPSINKKSTYVPDDVKKPIKAYLTAMGLTRKKKKRPRAKRV